MATSGERLVVLADDAADAALAELRSYGRVTQVASRRLVVLESEEDPAVLGSLPGVVVSTASELPVEVASGLDEGEALFASAWSSRMRQETKTRPGEGLSWDAPGFQPPDPPPAPRGPVTPKREAERQGGGKWRATSASKKR